MTRQPSEEAPPIDAAEVRERLEKELHHFFGRRRTILDLHTRSSPNRSSWTLAELDVRLDDNTMLQMMFKDVGWSSLSEVARGAKPAFLYDPLREIVMYRDVLAPERLS